MNSNFVESWLYGNDQIVQTMLHLSEHTQLKNGHAYNFLCIYTAELLRQIQTWAIFCEH